MTIGAGLLRRVSPFESVVMVISGRSRKCLIGREEDETSERTELCVNREESKELKTFVGRERPLVASELALSLD